MTALDVIMLASGVLYAALCGMTWMLRGGKFGAIVRAVLHVEPGTTITRLSCALMMVLALSGLFGFQGHAFWWSLAVWASIYLTMTIGYFGEAMAVNDWRERGLMSLWGFAVAGIMLAPIAVMHGPLTLAWAAIGVLVGPIYALNKPFGRRLGLDWTERSELLTGCVFGTALWCAVSVPHV